MDGITNAIASGGPLWLWMPTAILLGADNLIADRIEPWLQLVSGFLVAAMALWMAHRTLDLADSRRATHGHDHHDHGHGHHDHEHHQHGEDAHAAAHQREIEEVVARGPVTTGKVILFGLSGGLVPCPAAVDVLLLSLQIGATMNGMILVAGFSIGLALTLVAAGVIAAIGIRHFGVRLDRQSSWRRRLPIASACILLAISTVSIWQGMSAIRRGAHSHAAAATAPMLSKSPTITYSCAGCPTPC